MAFKRFVVELLDSSEVILVVDTDFLTEEVCQGINEYYCDHKYRFNKSNSHTLAVIEMIAEACARIQIENNYNTYGVMTEFSKGNMEALPALDGTQGIVLESISIEDIEPTNISISKADGFPKLPKPNL